MRQTTVYDSYSELESPGGFLIDAWRELAGSFSVAFMLFRSGVRARYRRAGLGLAWLLLPTVGTTILWVFVKSRGIIELAPTGVPYPVHVMIGMMLWQVFVDALNIPMQQLSSGRQLIARTRVPHEALLLAGVLEVLLNCAVRLIPVAVVMVAYRISPSWTVLFAPAGILALMILGLAIGLLVAPIGMLYDDVGKAIALATGFWFFLTPVLYRAPAGGLLRNNPVTPLLETARAWITGGASDQNFAAVAVGSIAALAVGWLFYRLSRPHVVARLG